MIQTSSQKTLRVDASVLLKLLAQTWLRVSYTPQLSRFVLLERRGCRQVAIVYES